MSERAGPDLPTHPHRLGLPHPVARPRALSRLARVVLLTALGLGVGLAGCASGGTSPATGPGANGGDAPAEREARVQQQDEGRERDEQREAEDRDSDLKPYDEVITEEAVTDSGLFHVHRVDGKLYYEVPDSLLRRDMLLVSRIARVPADLGGFIHPGFKAAEQVVRWQKRDDGRKVLLRKEAFSEVASDTTAIHQSVIRNNFAPILAAWDVEAINPDSNAAVIEVTDFFESDVPAISGLSRSQRESFGVRRLDGDRSFVNWAKSFPENVDVRHTLTFEATEPPVNASAGTISMEMHQSMVLLPEEPMRPRHADARVGYFDVTRINYGLDRQKAAEQTFIRRWRLEPKDPEAYARGELVEPVEPIVYYLDPATPEKWRPWVKKGVEDWNEAFEAAGFRNAIEARDPPSPEEDPDWSPEDVRHSTVRWAASTTRNAMGPSVSDPRSGEIIESDIVWYHNHMRSYRNRLMLETGAANPLARSLPIDDELMGEAMRAVIAHEVGHAVGLPHNMIASSAYPVDSLRDPDFARRMGVAPTIMDYARQNYVAQPGDGLEGTDFIRQIGPYDRYAIEWGYRVIPEAGTPEEEKPVLDAWILERAGDPTYRYMPQRFPTVNPEAQTEDLGDDPVRASGYGIANLKRVLPELIEWTSTPGEDWSDLEELYAELVGQWSRYVNHVVSVVGGVHVNLKAADQAGPVYTPVAGDEARRAVEFLVEQVFEGASWLDDPEILGRIEHAGGVDRIRRVQISILNSLLAPRRMQRLVEAETRNPERAYPLAELMEDVKRGVWGELRSGEPVDAYRRNLQRAHVERLEWLLTEEPEEFPDSPFVLDTPVQVSQSDIRPLARDQLRTLGEETRRTAGRAGDRMTRVHLRDVAERIERILEGDGGG